MMTTTEERSPVAARLAGGDVCKIATAGKPCCYGNRIDFEDGFQVNESA
jgi:hypothetical protein